MIDECDCDCHSSDGCTMHIIPCCNRCPHCQRNIIDAWYQRHVAECGAECPGCNNAKAIPGAGWCFTCDPSYPRWLPTATGPGSARVRRVEAPIQKALCEDCGRVNCEAKKFLDKKPQWVGDDGTYYREKELECQEAAKTLWQRYSLLWLAAMEAVEDHMNGKDGSAVIFALAEFMRGAQ